MAHELRFDPHSPAYANEVICTFTGPVPREGEAVERTALRYTDQHPRHRDGYYFVTKVMWVMTDEGHPASAIVYALPRSKDEDQL